MEAVAPELLPPDEVERLTAVARYEILDTPADGAFDRITTLASRFLHAPIATITIVDHDRIWFKSKHGLEVEQIDRAAGLCASAILQDEPWIVENADLDPRTLDNPLVRGELGLRFYAGMPLKTRDGYNLGTLNVIDSEPRTITDEEVDTLRALAAIVIDELELRLAARREEQRLEDVRSDFVVTASHELRTPLAAVYGAAKSLARPITDEQKALLLGVIESESERLATIVQQLLDATEIESGRVALVRASFDPVWPARRVVEAATASSDEARVTLTVHGEPAEIDTDQEKVRRILANLVDNAVKYSEPGAPVEVIVEQAGDGVRYSVRDAGAGVPEGEHERVFQRFYRLDPHMRSGVGGSGLGLHIARELARQLRGTLRIVSASEQGSTFVLELPAVL